MQDLIERHARQLVSDQLADFPAVALIGPRQCGKTTLAQSIGGEYFDLEQTEEQTRLNANWNDFMSGSKLLIFDEAQSMPQVFSRLRGEIDAQRQRNGRFLLLGSVAPSLQKHVSESLAGRLARVELTGFVAGELPSKPLDSLWLYGGYPDGGILRPKQYYHWQKEYLASLVERDLPNWGVPATAQTMRRLLLMLASVHGQSWNASQIGQSLAVSHHTVNTYVDYLAGCFLVRRLMPYYKNIRKRLVKSPKVYIRDSGLLHSLLGLHDGTRLLNQPWVGASWEGFVIEQITATLQNTGNPFEAYYLRTSDQYEIDLIIEINGQIWAIEIKLSSHPAPEDMERLNKVADSIAADRRILISRIKNSFTGEKTTVCNLRWFLEHLPTLY